MNHLMPSKEKAKPFYFVVKSGSNVILTSKNYAREDTTINSMVAVVKRFGTIGIKDKRSTKYYLDHTQGTKRPKRVYYTVR